MQHLIQSLEGRLLLSASPPTVKTKAVALQPQAASINADFAALSGWEQARLEQVTTDIRNAKDPCLASSIPKLSIPESLLAKKTFAAAQSADKRTIAHIKADFTKLSKHPTDAALQARLNQDRGTLFAAVPTDQKVVVQSTVATVPTFFVATSSTTFTPVFSPFFSDGGSTIPSSSPLVAAGILPADIGIGAPVALPPVPVQSVFNIASAGTYSLASDATLSLQSSSNTSSFWNSGAVTGSNTFNGCITISSGFLTVDGGTTSSTAGTVEITANGNHTFNGAPTINGGVWTLNGFGTTSGTAVTIVKAATDLNGQSTPPADTTAPPTDSSTPPTDSPPPVALPPADTISG